MKKLICYLMILGLIITCYPNPLKAVNAFSGKENTSILKESGIVKAKSMILRLEEIKTLAKKDLSQAEKQNLKKEVKTIKQDLARLDGGIYLSAGAIILILIIIIILF